LPPDALDGKAGFDVTPRLSSELTAQIIAAEQSLDRLGENSGILSRYDQAS
jgi:hypothetical protein